MVDNNLKESIAKLKKEKNAVILAHYYQVEEIQEIADFVGDSLALAQWAAKTDAEVIVLCGVHFMGETAKILCPEKRVFIPDLNAGCSLADSCDAVEFEKFIQQYPDHTVISYVNTSAAVKALTDIVVTSSNARQIIETLPSNAPIIFGPDRNLGNYINSLTGRNMVLWDGACHVHEQFSVEKIIELKKKHSNALLIAHPECKTVILNLADHIGSTASLLKFTSTSNATEFIVATEVGILFEMRNSNPNKTFIPAPPNDSTCACNECNFMKLNTVQKLYLCLKNENPEIYVDETVRLKAVKSIIKMLDLSRKLGL
ncbi:quinolinate synthase subunit A [Bacteroidales bacterium]|nr:quinolinate synthase subunit A [Bacteroidales bacterium]